MLKACFRKRMSGRELSGVEMVDSVSDMILTTPVQEWNNRTRSIDVPDYVVSFSGIVCSALSLALDDATVDALAQFLLDLFGVEPEFQDFILNDYLPEVGGLEDAETAHHYSKIH